MALSDTNYPPPAAVLAAGLVLPLLFTCFAHTLLEGDATVRLFHILNALCAHSPQRIFADIVSGRNDPVGHIDLHRLLEGQRRQPILHLAQSAIQIGLDCLREEMPGVTGSQISIVKVHRISYNFRCAAASVQVLTAVNLGSLILVKICREFLIFLQICLSFRL